jgi:hypothetical protein
LWWRALTGSDETLDNTHLMRLAGRFSRRIQLAEEYLAKTKITQGVFLILVGRAQAPVWDVSANHYIERKKPMP